MLSESMLKLLNKISFYNKQCKKKMVRKELIYEESENLKDLETLLKKFQSSVRELEQINCKNTGLVIEKFIKIHIMLQNIQWHIEQLHELTVMVIKRYDKAIEE